MRIRQLIHYPATSGQADFLIFGSAGITRFQIRIKRVKSEERTRVLMATGNRPRSADECRREKGGGVWPGVCISWRPTNIMYIKACAGIREHSQPTMAKRVCKCRTLVNSKKVSAQSSAIQTTDWLPDEKRGRQYVWVCSCSNQTRTRGRQFIFYSVL